MEFLDALLLSVRKINQDLLKLTNEEVNKDVQVKKTPQDHYDNLIVKRQSKAADKNGETLSQTCYRDETPSMLLQILSMLHVISTQYLHTALHTNAS